VLTFLGSIVPHPPFAGEDLRVVAQTPVQPRDRVAHLEPGILDGARETVPGAGAAEREQVTAGLEDSQALGAHSSHHCWKGRPLGRRRVDDPLGETRKPSSRDSRRVPVRVGAAGSFHGASQSLPMNSSPYGGSVTTESTDASGRVRSTSRQSPWWRVTPWPRRQPLQVRRADLRQRPGRSRVRAAHGPPRERLRQLRQVARLMPNQPKTPIRSVRIPDEEWRAAQARAAERGETVTDLIRRALRRYAK
jgi:hypothetical protein